jgi:coenzyme F420-reducing hydrogenase delta subunit
VLSISSSLFLFLMSLDVKDLKKQERMAVTRSKAAHQTWLASLNPQSIEAFKEGIGSVLRQWTALELAVFHQWGGANGKERAEALKNELVEIFLAPEKVYKDDISLILEDYLETEFSTICEDGSPDELGELFCSMWRQCLDGNYTMVTDILAKEYMRHEVITQSQGLSAGDIDDGESDDEEGAEGMEDTVAEQTQTALQQIQEENQMEEVEPEVPKVDADGWEIVDRSQKKNNKKKSYKI